MIKKIITLLKHWREAKSAFSTLSYLYGGESGAMDALGGLTEEEIQGIIKWLPEEGTFVEVGTLFGLTAKRIAAAKPKLRIIAVDNFSWNPFGLPGKVHEAFTRQILEGTRIEVESMSSEELRAKVEAGERVDAIFFDADHRYEAAKTECEWAKGSGIKLIMGHDYNNPNPRFGVTRAVDETFGKDRVESVGMCWRIV